MRFKIIILCMLSFLVSLLSMFFKGRYAIFNSLWMSLLYSVCVFLLAAFLIVNYDKNLSFWAPKNKKQEMNFVAIYGGSIVALMLTAFDRC